MISQRIKDILSISFDAETIEKACEKMQRKIDEGSFKDPNNEGKVEAYIRAICEGNKKAPKDKAQSYNLYRAENIYTELVKENGKDWMQDCMIKINDFPDDVRTKIKNEARTHYWYCKRIGDYRSPLTEKETEILGKMLASGKRKDGFLTMPEKDLSDKVVTAWKKFDSEILCESMAVLFETRYKKQWEKTTSDKNLKLSEAVC